MNCYHFLSFLSFLLFLFDLMCGILLLGISKYLKIPEYSSNAFMSLSLGYKS